MNNLTIGWLKSVKITNGERIEAFDEVEAHKVAVSVKSKENLPALYAYQGVKGTYSPSNVFFVDIDTKVGVEEILQNKEELFSSIPFAYALQKSASGKLHIVCLQPELIEDKDSWRYYTKLYTLTVCEIINRVFGWDYLVLNGDNGKPACDISMVKYTQAFFFTPNPWMVNEYATRAKLSTSDEITLKQKYPDWFEDSKEFAGDGRVTLKDIDIDFNAVVGKLTIDRNYTVGKYSGNDLRWRIGSYLACTYGGEKAKVIVDKLFENPEDFTFYDKGINQLVKTWFESTFPFISSRVIPTTPSNKYDEYERTHLEKIELGDEEWISDYVDKIEGYIQNTQVLAVKAGTGTGKTTLLKSIAEKYSHKALIVTPYNATNQLYEWSNIVSAVNRNEFEPERWNTMIWDQVLKHYNEIERNVEIIFVDESHEVFFEWWRDSSVGFMLFLKEWKERGKKIVLMSATPAGEVYELGANVIEFTRKGKRNVKVNIIKTSDTFSEMNIDMCNKFYDKVCIFSDRDVQSLYSRAVVSKIPDVKIYHMKWWEHNVEELKRQEVLSSRVNLLTRVAFNGLNIRNTGEKILVDVRYTEGITTWNEIIQIVGRFRDNKNVTLNIYNDGKFKHEENREDVFSNAKTICEGGNAELVSDYQIRMNKKEVQDACKCVDEYKSTWSLEDIKAKLVENGWRVKEKENYIDDEWEVKIKNPLKKEASDLMLSYRAGEMTRVDFDSKMNTGVKGAEMGNYIKEWEKDLRELEMVSAKLVEVAMMECKKQNTLISTAIDKIKRIKMVTSMSDDMWRKEVEARKGVLERLKGKDVVKHAMHIFKMDDTIRKKYKDIIGVNWGVGEQEDYDVDPFDVLFRIVSEEVKQSKVIKSECQKGKHSKSHKQHKLSMYRCMETGELRTKPEWLQELKCNEERFKYLIKRGLYVKEQ